MLNRKLLTLAVSGVVIAAANSAFAQGYPNKPIDLIVPFEPGGGTDITARMVIRALRRVGATDHHPKSRRRGRNCRCDAVGGDETGWIFDRLHAHRDDDYPTSYPADQIQCR